MLFACRLHTPRLLAKSNNNIIIFAAAARLKGRYIPVRNMSVKTALGKGYEGNGDKSNKVIAVPRPSSRYVNLKVKQDDPVSINPTHLSSHSIISSHPTVNISSHSIITSLTLLVSSVILISPQNQILLLRRVQTSSSFASAHVFPGGNISPFHDGEPPASQDAARHNDSHVYRMAAIRETFEESGILLAKTRHGRLLHVDEEEREKVRKLVHADKFKFEDWLEEKGAKADLGNVMTCFLRERSLLLTLFFLLQTQKALFLLHVG
jgi:8-oxo-dGTP pyrophosphatase MutT (NUDIX family)